jgi:hypothetical protein
MITADQIQTILNHASKAPTTVGQALNDGPAFAALVAVGQGLAIGKKLVWAAAVDSKDLTA